MRTFDAIAASAGLLGCAAVFATAHHGVVNQAAVAEDARALEFEIGRAFQWLAGAFERCYAMADTLEPHGLTSAEAHRARAQLAQACAPVNPGLSD
jgi:hypothetical protein